ncbi:MAG: MBL fold metallo-hydrolase [Polyangiaceae bacterium]|nr:MBL fold metallo-hydrolase [Polyangiaceae bacterium]
MHGAGAARLEERSARRAPAFRAARGRRSLELVVLSHPHEDHAAGFAQLVDAHPPRRVMVTARAPEGPFLHDAMSALLGGSASAPTSARLVHGEVLAAIRAVRRLVDDGVEVVAGIEPTSSRSGRRRSTFAHPIRARIWTASSVTSRAAVESAPTMRASSSSSAGATLGSS